jgi:hypothetical protein
MVMIGFAREGKNDPDWYDRMTRESYCSALALTLGGKRRHWTLSKGDVNDRWGILIVP